MTHSAQQFLSRATLAEKYEVSRRTIIRWEQAGLPHYKIAGGCVRFNPAEVDEWLDQYRRVTGYKHGKEL